ncbi:MAG: hypothetical protein QOG36_55 [Actinomycetota bacterium]|nr:hypothetical protein [Actinomycetota bacterium]
MRIRSIMSKSAGWGAGGVLAGLGVATIYAGHPAQTLGSFAAITLGEGLWIGAIGIGARVKDLRVALPGPGDARYLRASWFGSPVVPLVLAATALAAIAAVRHQALLAGACAGVSGGFALTFALLARLYDVAEHRDARRYWAPGRGLGGPVYFTDVRRS